MKTISNDIWNKLFYVSTQVRDTLKKRGFVIPIEENGVIKIGDYIIKKENNFYNIQDSSKYVIIGNINLPHTAIMLANKLALGKFLDNDLINKDRNFGYAEFEENLQSKIKSKDVEIQEVRDMKYKIAKHKKERYFNQINKDFKKLCSLV